MTPNTMTQPDSSPLQFSVVVPVRDEAGNIVPLVAEIHAALRGRGSYEIIYVDDGSNDTTAAELAALNDPLVRVLRHDQSFGQSQAVITGAVAARGTWIITLDGDGQNDPADIAALMAAGLSSDTLYIGHRTQRHDSATRQLASCVAYYARRLMLGDPTPDSGCGLRLIPRDLFLALPRFNALHRFTSALVVRAGGTVVSVPISHRPRLRGRSKYGIWTRGAVGVVDLFGVRWLMARHNAAPRSPGRP